jgi:hypothetical protein
MTCLQEIKGDFYSTLVLQHHTAEYQTDLTVRAVALFEILFFFKCQKNNLHQFAL